MCSGDCSGRVGPGFHGDCPARVGPRFHGLSSQPCLILQGPVEYAAYFFCSISLFGNWDCHPLGVGTVK